MEGAGVRGGEEELSGADPRTQLLMGLLQPSQFAPVVQRASVQQW